MGYCFHPKLTDKELRRPVQFLYSAEKCRTLSCKFARAVVQTPAVQNADPSLQSVSNQCPIIVQSRSNQPHPEVRPLLGGKMFKKSRFLRFWASIQPNPADYKKWLFWHKTRYFSATKAAQRITAMPVVRSSHHVDVKLSQKVLTRLQREST